MVILWSKAYHRGGLELLFDNRRRHVLELPQHGDRGEPTNAGFLISYIRDNLVSNKRTDMFVVDDKMYVACHALELADRTSRPGILVLINDADWELEGEAAYELRPNDNVLFVSTLHGG